jgi:hypothetical protein
MTHMARLPWAAGLGFVLAVAAGCATSPVGHITGWPDMLIAAPVTCQPNQTTCEITVTEDVPDPNDPSRCRVKVNLENVEFEPSDKRDIQWTASAGYELLDVYVVGDSHLNDNDREFKFVAKGNQTFKLKNRHSKHLPDKPFEYIVLAAKSGEPCKALDPWITNK